LGATTSNSLLKVLDCWSAALKAFYSKHLYRFMPALGTDVCRCWTVGVNCWHLSDHCHRYFALSSKSSLLELLNCCTQGFL